MKKLSDQSEQNNKALRLSEDTFLDIFRKYVKDPESLPVLTMPEENRLKRVIFAKNLIKEHPGWTQTEFCNSVAREFSITYTTAFYDVKVATQSLGFDFNEEPLYWKEFISRMLLKVIARQDARSIPNDDIIIKACLALSKVTGIEEDTLNKIRREDYGDKNLILMIKSENHIHYQALDKLEQNNPEVIESIISDLIDNELIELPADAETGSQPDIEDPA